MLCTAPIAFVAALLAARRPVERGQAIAALIISSLLMIRVVAYLLGH
jgi:DUF1365 family protein